MMRKKSLLDDVTRSALRRLFDGTQYVFCASAINAAVSKCIFAIANDSRGHYSIRGYNSLLIGLNVGYAITSHFIGCLLHVFYPKGSKLHEYITTVGSENAVFAWQKTTCLIVLRWVSISGNNKGISILAWVIIAVLIFVLIIVMNVFRFYFLNLANDDLHELTEYDGECFALALAYSFTLILVVYIYSDSSSNYLGGGDDINPIDDDVSHDRNKLHVLFVLYCVALTAVVFYGDVIDIPRHIYNKFLHLKKKILPNSSENNSDCIASNHAYQPPSEFGAGLSQSTERNDSKEIGDISKLYLPQSCCLICFCCTCQEFLDKAFSWDQSHLLDGAFFTFFKHFSAYMVVCAWYSWSVLSLQTYFLDSVVGLLIFAIIISLLFSFMLLSIDNRRKTRANSNGTQSDERSSIIRDTLHNEKSESVVLISGQFICGWSWNLFITSLIFLCIGGRDIENTSKNDWNKAIATFCFVFILLSGIGFYKLQCADKSLNSTSDDGYSTLDKKPTTTESTTIVTSPSSPSKTVFLPGIPSDNGSIESSGGDGSWQIYDGNKATNKRLMSQLEQPLL